MTDGRPGWAGGGTQAEGSQGPPGDKVESNDESIMEEKGHEFGAPAG